MISQISFAGNQQNLGEGEGWDAPFYKCATLTGLVPGNVYDDLNTLIGGGGCAGITIVPPLQGWFRATSTTT